MKALSISRPWGALILRTKDVENRSWSTRYRGPLLVHSSKSWDDGAFDFAARLGVPGFGLLIEEDYPTGIVGVVDLEGICDRSVNGGSCGCGPWAIPGQRHWRLTNPRPLPEPIPCGGARGLWEPSPDVLAAVGDQLGCGGCSRPTQGGVMNDDMVWMTTASRRAAFHMAPDGERRTPCGLPFGDVIDGKPARGVLLSESEAKTEYAAVHCGRCYEPDKAVKPRVGRRGGPTGAHR